MSSENTKRTINISTRHQIPWQRQLPNGVAEWDGWRFIFNAVDENYDYLVAFDDLHAPIRPRCRPENVIHLASEPPAICRYNEGYLAQFGWSVTQDKDCRHPARIFYPAGINWFLGCEPQNPERRPMNFEELEAVFEVPKTRLLSMISSDKASKEQHAARLAFAKRLKEHYGEDIEFFGRGIRPFADKLEALRDYRFHVVLENSSVDHYFTEKLTDCLIAGSYPLYYGCPNLEEYFPVGSFARIDINDFEGAVATIDAAIAADADRTNRQTLRQARDLAMKRYNLFPLLVEIITNIEAGRYGAANKPARYAHTISPFSNRRFRKGLGPGRFPGFRRRLFELAVKIGYR